MPNHVVGIVYEGGEVREVTVNGDRYVREEEPVVAASPASEISGLRKSDAKFKRKAVRLADELASHIVKNGSLRHEVHRLEDVLAWAYRTKQPVEEIRAVIERTIPKRLGSDELDPLAPRSDFGI